MHKILMAEPNISEGRRQDAILKMVTAAQAVPGATVMDYSSDADHNRSVITIIGEPRAVLEAAKALARLAFELIDMSRHSGEHPRQGAVDVCAFIPIRNVSDQEALQVCRQFAAYVGDLGVPVYYYEAAASGSQAKRLPDLRRGGYEALAAKLADPAWRPDEGPAEFNARSGAMVTGTRLPLVAFNANLNTSDIKIATEIARAVRYVSGGFRYVRALGIMLHERGIAQVSMNLLDYRRTPISRVLQAVRAEADRYGVRVIETEIIGPVSVEMLVDVARHYLQAHELSPGQVVEMAVLETIDGKDEYRSDPFPES